MPASVELKFKLKRAGGEALGALGRLRGRGGDFQLKCLQQQRCVRRNPKDSWDMGIYNWTDEEEWRAEPEHYTEGCSEEVTEEE